MRKKKQLLSLVLCAALAASGITGCGQNTGKSTDAQSGSESTVQKQGDQEQNGQEQVETSGGNGIVASKPDLTGTIRIGYMGLNEKTGPDPITGNTIYGADELEKWLNADYPGVDFEIIVYPVKDHYTKAKALMEAKQVDVLVESATAQIWQEGYSLDLLSYMEKDKEYDVNLHNSERVATYYREINPEFPTDDSKRIANCLPYDGSAEIMFYDAELFEQWGVEPLSDEPTLDEIYEKAEKMTGINPVTGEQNYGIFFPTGGRTCPWNLATVVNALGGDVGDYMPNEWDISVKVDSPEWVKGLEWVKSIQPFTPPGSETGQGQERFGRPDNNVAMYFGMLAYSVFSYEALGLTDKFEPVSRPANENGEHARLGGTRVQIMKSTGDPDLAWEIAKWFSVGNGQKFLLSTQIGWPTSIKALGSDTKMTDEELKALEIGSHIMKKTPVDALSLYSIMIDAIESVTLQGVTPQQALTQAEQKKVETYAALKQAATK